jgi:hypothetical protein
VQIAEDTLIDLDGLELRGRKWQNVRSALNRAGKEGIAYRQVVLADEPWAVRAQVRAISEEWVGDKGLPEMGFTLGGIDEALDPQRRVGLAIDTDGSVHGVTSWLPAYCAGTSTALSACPRTPTAAPSAHGPVVRGRAGRDEVVAPSSISFVVSETGRLCGIDHRSPGVGPRAGVEGVGEAVAAGHHPE